jgi:hypothetical protein
LFDWIASHRVLRTLRFNLRQRKGDILRNCKCQIKNLYFYGKDVPMSKIMERARRLQALFEDRAEEIAKQAGFIKRRRKINAIGWLLAVALGWTNNKKGTLESLVEQFELQGVDLTEQAVSKRFGPTAAEFLKQMTAYACKLLVDDIREVLPLTQDFNGIYVEDSSSVCLPSELVDEFPGCGSYGSGLNEKGAKGASIKTFCRIEVLSGHFKERRIDAQALLGEEKLPIRLIALRAPEHVIRQRHERLKKDAKRKGRNISQEQRNLCAWTVFATNLPAEKYTTDEVYTLYRVRWQIELVFKLWKSEGGVAASHGKTGGRCLCEFLAKILGQIIANWLMLLRGGRLGEASPTLLYRRVCQSIPKISEALWRRDDEALLEAITELLKIGRASCRERVFQPV